MINTAVCTCN